MHASCWCLLAGCFLAACWMDVKTKSVYQFIWWIGAAGAFGLLVANDAMTWGVGLSIFIFCLIQEKFFSKFYGRADCHGFCVCAVTLAALGGGMTVFFLQETIAFSLLTIVQFLRRNIGERGRLKVPVAFVPYITVSFGITILTFAKF